jgi:hypothetical protein
MTSSAEALTLWNTTAARCGWPLVRGMSSDRERKLRELVKVYGLDGWKEMLAKAEASDFLCGRTERNARHSGWRFSFDAAVRESFFLKIIEGNYDNKEREPGGSIKSGETILWEARLRSYKPGGMWLGIWGPSPADDACQAPRALVEAWRANHVVH